MNINTLSSVGWYESIDNFPIKYQFKLKEECFQIDDGKKFVIQDQIIYILKTIVDSEFFKEKKITKMGQIIGRDYKKIEKPHSIFDFIKTEKNYMRLVNLDDLLSPEANLNKEIKKYFSEKDCTLLFSKIQSMKIIKMNEKISKIIKENLGEVVKIPPVSPKETFSQLPTNLPDCKKNFECNEKTMQSRERALRREIEVLNLLKIDFNKFRVEGFVFYSQIISLLDKKYDNEELSFRTYLMNHFLRNNKKIIFSNPRENKKQLCSIFCKKEYLNKSDKVAIYIFRNDKKGNVFPLVRDKLDDLFGKEHIQMILTKISKLAVCTISNEEKKNISKMINQQKFPIPLGKNVISPLQSLEKTKNNHHLEINYGENNLSNEIKLKKRKIKATPVLEISLEKGTAPTVEQLIFKDDKNNNSFVALCDSENLALIAVGTNLSPIKLIQFAWMEENEKIDWELAPELTYIKEESSAICIKVQLGSGMLLPGKYMLKITCEGDQFVETPFSAK